MLYNRIMDGIWHTFVNFEYINPFSLTWNINELKKAHRHAPSLSASFLHPCLLQCDSSEGAEWNDLPLLTPPPPFLVAGGVNKKKTKREREWHSSRVWKAFIENIFPSWTIGRNDCSLFNDCRLVSKSIFFLICIADLDFRLIIYLCMFFEWIWVHGVCIYCPKRFLFWSLFSFSAHEKATFKDVRLLGW